MIFSLFRLLFIFLLLLLLLPLKPCLKPFEMKEQKDRDKYLLLQERKKINPLSCFQLLRCEIHPFLHVSFS